MRVFVFAVLRENFRWTVYDRRAFRSNTHDPTTSLTITDLFRAGKRVAARRFRIRRDAKRDYITTIKSSCSHTLPCHVSKIHEWFHNTPNDRWARVILITITCRCHGETVWLSETEEVRISSRARSSCSIRTIGSPINRDIAVTICRFSVVDFSQRRTDL